MRCGMIMAAALAVMATTSSARADDEWCGYAMKDKAIIECGYSTVAECQNVVGNGGMCFIDPDYALDERRATMFAAANLPALPGKEGRWG